MHPCRAETEGVSGNARTDETDLLPNAPQKDDRMLEPHTVEPPHRRTMAAEPTRSSNDRPVARGPALGSSAPELE